MAAGRSGGTPAEEQGGALEPRPSSAPRPRRRRQRRAKAPGTPPGVLVADPEAPKPVIRVLAYGPDAVDERQLAGPDEVAALLGKRPVTWVQVAGLGDAAVLEKLGAIFHLHRLALEDVLNTQQRAKLERYEGHQVLFLRLPEMVDGQAVTEQMAIFFGAGFVLTFDERPGDCFDPIRKRLREGTGRLRGSGPDYLAYALLDSVIDAYFPVVETASERLDVLEDDILAGAAAGSLIGRIHVVRRDLLTLRRALWPLREVVSALQREDSGVGPETRLYLRDVYDHVVNLMDTLENQREIAGALLELHLSAVSNRMNEVMKVLTVISTIFMPLTFIVGIYGMNFDPDASPLNMPELRWAWGYPFALLLMLGSVVTMLAFFVRRGWIGRRAPDAPGGPR
jgi:magnesium transporter